ncbi:MAG TPA: type IX secretion system sortase PorU, partial [Saprospiraceae bacterium]|nr:type IX secretion system sortase PorU [Saprospiraceae bacterium]
FAKMLYERKPDKFEFLLLLGDGSFDPKNNTNSTDNKDFIPVFETVESLYPVTAYPSDDYYALLNDEEGGNINLGALDIAVGRIPARSPSEAQAVIEKVIAYDKDPATLGDWRLRTVFVGDDEEFNVHLNQAEKLGNQVRADQRFLNVDKIFLDAYNQVATSAGARYPDVNQAITAAVFRGAQVLQYVGHGGPRGWAQERILTLNDIGNWENPNRYPLLITATCSFGGYDDYSNLTGGEQALLRTKAGAIGLFTTVRAVYIIDNNKLTDAVQNFIYQKVNGRYRPIGDILKDAKNSVGSSAGDNNARRFTLLGDPAMYLAMPEYNVATTRVNGKPVAPGQPDTLRALSAVEMEAAVVDAAGNVIGDFNGRAFVTLFDKAQQLQTLGQDNGSLVVPFKVQRNIIFKGVATVKNGAFKFNFVVPKDINYTYGFGKISYYEVELER